MRPALLLGSQWGQETNPSNSVLGNENVHPDRVGLSGPDCPKHLLVGCASLPTPHKGSSRRGRLNPRIVYHKLPILYLHNNPLRQM